MTVPEEDELLTPQEVAKLFRVSSKTVVRWSAEGKLESVRTLGNHRRYRRDVVMALLTARGTGRHGKAGQ